MARSPAGILTKLWSDFTGLMYPHTCVGCGYVLSFGNLWLCWSCVSKLPLTGFEKKRFNLVEDLFAGRLPVEKASSLLFFAKGSLVQHLVHCVKYKGDQDLGLKLGERMGKALVEAGWQHEIDMIVALPLNHKKQIKRGFNQADLLARGMGKIMDRPVENGAVIRSKFTATQTRKSREERWDNVGEVFELAHPALLQNKHVLLVDDVVTTGASLDACGQVLLQVPGLRLSIATLAFASAI